MHIIIIIMLYNSRVIIFHPKNCGLCGPQDGASAMLVSLKQNKNAEKSNTLIAGQQFLVE